MGEFNSIAVARTRNRRRAFKTNMLEVRVPFDDMGVVKALRCAVKVFEVAFGDLSLPGKADPQPAGIRCGRDAAAGRLR